MLTLAAIVFLVLAVPVVLNLIGDLIEQRRLFPDRPYEPPPPPSWAEVLIPFAMLGVMFLAGWVAQLFH
jgi:hypothetical protein